MTSPCPISPLQGADPTEERPDAREQPPVPVEYEPRLPRLREGDSISYLEYSCKRASLEPQEMRAVRAQVFGLRGRAIALALGCTDGAAYKALSEGLRKLRAYDWNEHERQTLLAALAVREGGSQITDQQVWHAYQNRFGNSDRSPVYSSSNPEFAKEVGRPAQALTVEDLRMRRWRSSAPRNLAEQLAAMSEQRQSFSDLVEIGETDR